MALNRETVTAEQASPRQLFKASVQLSVMLIMLVALVVPLIRELPLGQSTRTGILAWLLVALGLYWLAAGLGFRALLLIQLLIFSTAAALLTTKIMLVFVGIHRLSILRRTARALIIVGTACAGLNLGAMLVAILTRRLMPGQRDLPPSEEPPAGTPPR